ncbi:hypothetical protein ACFRKB_28875 [Streptomyces scopuliridis]|uniref:hypothetical protein n=1 Tax=Streptomyces scopuliridis TaxID=452529 RepID=UPI0036B0763F
MPSEGYTFAIERDETGYTLEASGNIARAGQQTHRFHRDLIVDDTPIWHYIVKPDMPQGPHVTRTRGHPGSRRRSRWKPGGAPST